MCYGFYVLQFAWIVQLITLRNSRQSAFGIYQTCKVNRGEGKWMLHGHVSGFWTLQVLLIPAVMFSNYSRLSVQKYKTHRLKNGAFHILRPFLAVMISCFLLGISFLSLFIFPLFSVFYSFLLIVLLTTFFLSSSSFKYF
jgi:hypothetical protein